jgi:hypothetical protein
MANTLSYRYIYHGCEYSRNGRCTDEEFTNDMNRLVCVIRNGATLLSLTFDASEEMRRVADRVHIALKMRAHEDNTANAHCFICVICILCFIGILVAIRI